MLINKKFKLNKIASKDKFRESINNIHLQGNWALATDSVALAAIPVTITEDVADVPQKIATKCWEEMLKSKDDVSNGDLGLDQTKVGNVIFVNPTQKDELFKDNISPIFKVLKSRVEDIKYTNKIKICINADELYKLSKAMGTSTLMLTTDEYVANKPILVLDPHLTSKKFIPVGMIRAIEIDFEETDFPTLSEVAHILESNSILKDQPFQTNN